MNCDLAQKELLAAAKHSAKAQTDLGVMYATGHCAIRDLPLAYRWFARAQHHNPSGDPRIAEDLKVLWNQMTPEERKLATP
jgi:TPR repeat protein